VNEVFEEDKRQKGKNERKGKNQAITTKQKKKKLAKHDIHIFFSLRVFLRQPLKI
jgi:hypothetical protein